MFFVILLLISVSIPGIAQQKEDLETWVTLRTVDFNMPSQMNDFTAHYKKVVPVSPSKNSLLASSTTLIQRAHHMIAIVQEFKDDSKISEEKMKLLYDRMQDIQNDWRNLKDQMQQEMDIHSKFQVKEIYKKANK